MISFEFTPTPKFINSAIESIKHLYTIGTVQFNYSFGEPMTLTLSEWIDAKKYVIFFWRYLIRLLSVEIYMLDLSHRELIRN